MSFAARARIRAYAGRFVDWLTPALVAAIVLALLEVAFIAMRLEASTSTLGGLGFLLAQVLAVFGLYGVVIAAVLALTGTLARIRVRRFVLRHGAWASAPLVALPIAAIFLLVERPFLAAPWEFPAEVSALHAVFTWLFLASLLLASRRLPRLDLAARRFPWSVRRNALAVALAFLVGAGSAIAHFLVAPENLHLDERSALIGVALLLGGTLAAGALLARTKKRHAAALAGVVAAAASTVLVPGPARAHARFVVWNHGVLVAPMVEVLRDRVDRDRDGSAPTWLGGTDCAEGDRSRGPLVREVPGDGIDQDCSGRDAPAPPAEPAASLPPGCLPPDRPNVVLLTVDALRADALTQKTFPAAFELARFSWVFTRAYAASAMTSTSLSAMQAGRPVSDLTGPNPLKDDTLDADRTLAERLAAVGYRTAVITALETHPLAERGFSRSRSPYEDDAPQGAKEALTSGAQTRAALDAIDAAAAAKAPFYVWVHYGDAHARYKIDGSYERGVAYVGRRVELLLAELKSRGLLDTTVVVLSADHGEELRARGREGHGPNLFEESIHVPLLVWVPGCRPRVDERPVSLTQLSATLGAITKVPVPGRGLLATNGWPTVVEGVVGHDGFFKRAVIGPQYKLIVDAANGGRMLFDLEHDPSENQDVYGAAPGPAARAEDDYAAWLDRPGAR